MGQLASLSSAALALPLSVYTAGSPARLALALQAQDAAGTVIPPPPKKRRIRGVGHCFSAVLAQTQMTGICQNHGGGSQPVHRLHSAAIAASHPQGRCQALPFSAQFALLSHAQVLRASERAQHVARCSTLTAAAQQRLNTDSGLRWRASAAFARCSTASIAGAQVQVTAQNGRWHGAVHNSRCQHITTAAAIPAGRCQRVPNPTAVPVPWEWYPIILPKPPKPGRSICRPPPAPHALPLALHRLRSTWQSPATLPLDFICWHDSSTASPIPILPSYPMTNAITASLNGTPIEILSAQIQTDAQSWCWQGSITIPPETYAQIPAYARGEEPLITVSINGAQWAFILETIRDNREFISYSYSLSGRSQTARLSSDYAGFKAGVNRTLYARQIAEQALEFTGYDIVQWDIPNWLIPENTYSYSGKTPIAILSDIAHAAGAILTSHPHKKQFSFIPRWKKPAWEISGADADISAPASVIVSISGERQNQPRANVVYAVGNEDSGRGACIYREAEAKDQAANTLNNPLFTDVNVLRTAGIAALSKTGNHKQESVKLPLSAKYNIPLAALGQIWKIKEPEGHWQGIVTGVQISVQNNNGVPEIWQTVQIDRYLDK